MNNLEFIRKNELVTFQVIPDRFLNNDCIEQFTRSLYDVYQSPLKRLKLENNAPFIQERNKIFWEISLETEKVAFYITVPQIYEEYLENQIHTCWSKATVFKNKCKIDFKSQKSIGSILHLKNHYMFALSTDRRTLEPLPALFEVINTLQFTDKAFVQIIIDPAPIDWYSGVQEAMDKFSNNINNF
jgi:hypothetical protein